MTIFVSYSHKNEAWKDRLVTQLKVLPFKDLEIWTDRRLGAGDEWYKEIDLAIERADLAILLISAEFLGSDFITKEEIPRLLKKKASNQVMLYPIIITPCVWEYVGWLSKIQVRPLDGRPLSDGSNFQIESDLASITKEIAEMLSLGYTGELEKMFASSGILKKEDAIDLYRLIEKVELSTDTCKKLYKLSLPDNFSPHINVRTLKLALEHLWNIPMQHENKYPVLYFIEWLAVCINEKDQELSSQLRDWVDGMASWLKLKQEHIDRMRSEIINENGTPEVRSPYLLVNIIPVSGNKNRSFKKLYRLHIVLWRSPEESRYLRKDDEALELSAIPTVLDQNLQQLSYDIPDEMWQLCLEFFLPIDLLSCDVDQWVKRDVFLDEIKLGEDHPVLVRSWERASIPQLQIHWYHRWKQFQSLLATKEPYNAYDCMELYKLKPYKERELYNHLLAAKNVSFLGLSFSPGSANLRCNLLREILRAGLPVALWPRVDPQDVDDEARIISHFEEMCAIDRLDLFPERLQQIRVEAASTNGKALGNHLSLLWDDPGRLPEDLIAYNKNPLKSP